MKNKKTALLCLTICLFVTCLQAQTKKPATKSKPVVTSAALKASVVRGQVVYAQNCLSCHQADGGGVQNMNAPLIKTTYVLGDNKKLITILFKGMQGVDIDGESYNNVMPQFTHLTDQQIADVLTYVRNSFGNKAPAISKTEVGKARADIK